MCSVNTRSGFLNPDSSTVRFAMKLPRYHSVAPRDPSASNSSGIRRSQSASSAAARSQRMLQATLDKSRSRSQEPQNHEFQTQILPIPGGPAGGRSSLSRSVDKSDLTRMYDYATWNMYERIVSARRRSLANQIEASQVESQGTSSSSSSRQLNDYHAKVPAKRSSSQDEATVDESDSFSSRTESPAFGGLALSPPEGGNEDHFIFQLDM